MVAKYHYKPFGDIALVEGTDSVLHKFNQQEEDRATGLQYFKARHYDPEIGRFTQADTIIPDPSNAQAYNRYMFVMGNPIMYADPTGHQDHWVTGGLGTGNNDSDDDYSTSGSGTMGSSDDDITCAGEINSGHGTGNSFSRATVVTQKKKATDNVSYQVYTADYQGDDAQVLLVDSPESILWNNLTKYNSDANFIDQLFKGNPEARKVVVIAIIDTAIDVVDTGSVISDISATAFILSGQYDKALIAQGVSTGLDVVNVGLCLTKGNLTGDYSEFMKKTDALMLNLITGRILNKAGIKYVKVIIGENDYIYKIGSRFPIAYEKAIKQYIMLELGKLYGGKISAMGIETISDKIFYKYIYPMIKENEE